MCASPLAEAALLARLLAALPTEHQAQVHAAYELAAALHAGQVRDEGDAYIVHPLRVALHLVEHGYRDPDLLAAALLHDVLEDTSVTEAELAEYFGPRVTALVWAVTKPLLRRRRDAARFLAAAGASEREAQLIKLADRLDNLLYLHVSPRQGMRLRVLEETRLKYLPHAVAWGGTLGEALIAAWQAQMQRLAPTPQ
ncbi:MAG TPA: HD domain-containing protein [Chloroflexota bacterium]|nr:HD domain-containing protein [Chloroflexota bacterium]